MGLLAWSPEPGEDGLLLFPGEQDDVTEHEERQKQGGINEAGSGDLVTFRHVSPKGSHPLPNSTPPHPSAHLLLAASTPCPRGALIIHTSPWPRRVAWLVPQVQGLPNTGRMDAKTIPFQGHTPGWVYPAWDPGAE